MNFILSMVRSCQLVNVECAFDMRKVFDHRENKCLLYKISTNGSSSLGRHNFHIRYDVLRGEAQVLLHPLYPKNTLIMGDFFWSPYGCNDRPNLDMRNILQGHLLSTAGDALRAREEMDRITLIHPRSMCLFIRQKHSLHPVHWQRASGSATEGGVQLGFVSLWKSHTVLCGIAW